jgi:hypothetical protein
VSWQWSDPVSVDPENTYDVTVELSKSAGGDHQTTLSGTLRISAPNGDVDTVLQELFEPAVTAGWLLAIKQSRRYESSLIYGG